MLAPSRTSPALNCVTPPTSHYKGSNRCALLACHAGFHDLYGSELAEPRHYRHVVGVLAPSLVCTPDRERQRRQSCDRLRTSCAQRAAQCCSPCDSTDSRTGTHACTLPSNTCPVRSHSYRRLVMQQRSPCPTTLCCTLACFVLLVAFLAASCADQFSCAMILHPTVVECTGITHPNCFARA
jgi:hypothetical protein